MKCLKRGSKVLVLLLLLMSIVIIEQKKVKAEEMDLYDVISTNENLPDNIYECCKSSDF